MTNHPTEVAQLPFNGRAGLISSGQVVNLRKKSLAILYYLAIEGPTDRAELAEILWGHVSARQNLRVELYELRRSLKLVGLIAFTGQKEVLELPPGIALDTSPRTGEVLDGLEGVSPVFSEWIAGLRRRSARGAIEPEEQLRQQAGEVARLVKAPFLLIIKGGPLAEYEAFAAQLARDLRLPFVKGLEGAAAAVRYLPTPQTDEQVDHILREGKSVWVVPAAPFGEDRRALLRLRSLWPAERARFVTIKPLTWSAARRGLLQDFSFDHAARLYLCTDGDAAFLSRLAQLREPLDDQPPLPQQVRAAYQHESRFLDYDTRLALERLVVHPGWLTEGVIAALDAEPHLDELERRGWLTFDDGWHFSSETTRRVLYHALQPGRRVAYHGTLARYFAAKGDLLSSAYHSLTAGQPIQTTAFSEGLSPWAQAVLAGPAGSAAAEPLTLRRGPAPVGEVIHEPPELLGTGWGLSLNTFHYVRNGPPFRSGTLRFGADEEDLLLRLEGRGRVENVLGVGLDGKRLPLQVAIDGAAAAMFASVEREELVEGVPLYPVDSFDAWFYLPKGCRFEIKGDAERVVLEVDVTTYRFKGPAPSSPGAVAVDVQ